MLRVRLAALAIIVAGGALLARPAEGTYIPPSTDPPPAMYCCCVKAWYGCTDQFCCSRTGCTSSASGCTVTQT